MNKEKLNEGKRRILTGALAGAMVLSSFTISVLTSEVQAAEASADKNVVLYTKDTQLSAMADKAATVNTYEDYKKGEYQKVTLNGDSITFEGRGAVVQGSDLLISAAGTYVLNGTLDDGAIIIDSPDEENVTLVLENVNITCKDGAPIYVKNCGKNVIISVPEGTENTISDGSSYTYEYKVESTDTETGETSLQPSAAIFSKADLKFNGGGKLIVNAHYNDGITGKDDVEIAEATLTINAADDGIVGKDSVIVKNGTITIKAEGDGIKSTNSEDTTKGYVAIADGTFNIISGNDGIQAETVLLTLGGDFTIKTGEGSAAGKASQENRQDNMPAGENGQSMHRPEGVSGAAVRMENKNTSSAAIKPEKLDSSRFTSTAAAITEETESTSAKALKAGTKIVIQDGNFNINSEDDAVHSNGHAALASGNFQIAAGDDGIHADTTLEIYGGDVNITKRYEGIESAEITIEGGSIEIVSSDDGINVAGGNDNSGFGGFGPMNRDSFTTSAAVTSQAIAGSDKAEQKLTINGGEINVNASGDGIDINGSGYMTGGTVAVSGPTNNGNGGLDYDGEFVVTGGTLIVAGASGMAQAPGSGTTVNTIAAAVTAQASGTSIQLIDSSGTAVMAFTPEKEFSHIVISSAVIQTGKAYKIMGGDTELASFTADSTVTNLSDNGAGNKGMAPRAGADNMQNGKMEFPNNGGIKQERGMTQNNNTQ